jgi:hypothetical protein
VGRVSCDVPGVLIGRDASTPKHSIRHEPIAADPVVCLGLLAGTPAVRGDDRKGACQG